MVEISRTILSRLIGALTGNEPFPWQRRLLELFKDGDIPDVLSIPTGLGKTSVIAIWLSARACKYPVPRRLIYVVDRRTVVDQATDYAERLREIVSEPAGGDLRAALDLDGELPISTLRGRFGDNRAWQWDPASPAIIVGTPDMIGSRLLFSGYGVAPGSRAFHAGLIGTDSLVVLDEAHLSQPFANAVRSVGALMRPEPGCRPIRLMQLSATPGVAPGGVPFELDNDDLENPVVARRVNASKSIEFGSADGKAPERDFAKEAWSLAAGTAGTRVLVFVHSFALAGKVRDELEKLARVKDTPEVEIMTLTGQRRGLERDALTRELAGCGFLAGADEAQKRTAILVATSAGEVGIDLDADHMVADLVSLDRMAQRLGRVNRRGEGTATVRILEIPVSEIGKRKPPPEAVAKRERLALTRELLGRDGSPAALGKALAAPKARQAVEPTPISPVLTPAIASDLSLTTCGNHAGRPSVATFLRGYTEIEPQVSVAWRANLPACTRSRSRNRVVREYLSLAPVRPSEILDTTPKEMARILKARAAALKKTFQKQKEELEEIKDDVAIVLVRNRRFHAQKTFEEFLGQDGVPDVAKAASGGQILVLLDPRVGGLDSFGLLTAKNENAPVPVSDAEDATIRELFEDVPTSIVAVEKRDGEWHCPDRAGERILRVIATRYSSESDVADPELSGLAVYSSDGVVAADTDLDRTRPPARIPTILEHARAVAEEARNTCQRLGLPTAMQDAFFLAGERHDDGKALPRWQRAAGVDALDGGPWAKPTGRIDNDILNRYRHEFGSLSEIENDASIPELERDLILHVVASHHGWARPFISAEGHDKRPPGAGEDTGKAATARFCRLTAQLDPWTLAYFETILRCADRRVSARD